jgi:hypothetical protein
VLTLKDREGELSGVNHVLIILDLHDFEFVELLRQLV